MADGGNTDLWTKQQQQPAKRPPTSPPLPSFSTTTPATPSSSSGGGGPALPAALNPAPPTTGGSPLLRNTTIPPGRAGVRLHKTLSLGEKKQAIALPVVSVTALNVPSSTDALRKFPPPDSHMGPSAPKDDSTRSHAESVDKPRPHNQPTNPFNSSGTPPPAAIDSFVEIFLRARASWRGTYFCLRPYFQGQPPMGRTTDTPLWFPRQKSRTRRAGGTSSSFPRWPRWPTQRRVRRRLFRFARTEHPRSSFDATSWSPKRVRAIPCCGGPNTSRVVERPQSQIYGNFGLKPQLIGRLDATFRKDQLPTNASFLRVVSVKWISNHVVFF